MPAGAVRGAQGYDPVRFYGRAQALPASRYEGHLDATSTAFDGPFTLSQPPPTSPEFPLRWGACLYPSSAATTTQVKAPVCASGVEVDSLLGRSLRAAEGSV